MEHAYLADLTEISYGKRNTIKELHFMKDCQNSDLYYQIVSLNKQSKPVNSWTCPFVKKQGFVD